MSELEKTSQQDPKLDNHQTLEEDHFEEEQNINSNKQDSSYSDQNKDVKKNKGSRQDGSQSHLQKTKSSSNRNKKSENDFKIFVGGLPGTIIEGNSTI